MIWHSDPALDKTQVEMLIVFAGNYLAISEALAEAGILAFGHDHVGHGQSEGIPAYIESVDDYVDDLIFHCQVPLLVKLPDTLEHSVLVLRCKVCIQ